MNSSLRRLFTLLLFCYSVSSVKAQCDLHPVIKPDNLVLCPNASDTLYVTQEFDSYQWYKLNKPIPGATQRYLPVNQYDDAGYLFKVVVTKNGCTDTSKKVLVDSYVFAGPVIATTGTPSYIDPQTGSSVYCKNDSVSFTFFDPYTTNIQWYNNGKPIPGANSQTYNVTGNGSYTVTGAPDVCPNYEVCECVPVNIAFDKFSVSVRRSCDSLLANKGVSFQWYLNGNEITGATNAYYIPSHKGLYSVEATDRYNCSSRSETIFVTPVNKMIISPNPAVSYITVSVNADNASQIIVSDLYGNRYIQIASTGDNQRIQIGTLHSGTYLLRVLDGKGNSLASEKFMKK